MVEEVSYQVPELRHRLVTCRLAIDLDPQPGWVVIRSANDASEEEKGLTDTGVAIELNGGELTRRGGAGPFNAQAMEAEVVQTGRQQLALTDLDLYRDWELYPLAGPPLGPLPSLLLSSPG